MSGTKSATTSPQPAGSPSEGRRRDDRPFGARFVTPMLLAAALNPINSSIIATALVSIAAAIGVSVGQTSILISSLYLTSAIAQPTAGRLAEEFGPRRVFLTGIVVVVIGGVVGGVASNLPTLVVARVLIGLGTSAGYPSAMLLIRRRASSIGLQATPRKVLGALAIASAATVAIGPTIGGLLVGWFDWRASFLINVPLAVITFVMGVLWIAKDTDQTSHRSACQVASRVDLAGVIGFGGAMTLLLVFLLSLPSFSWVPFVGSIAVSIGLVRWELRAANPFIDVRLLRSNMPLTRTYIRQGLTLLGIYTILFGLTQWIEVVRGLSAYKAGFVLIPMGVLSACSARVVSGRNGVHKSLVVSACFLIAGAIGTLFLDSRSPIILIVLVTGAFGLVSGFSNVSNQTALYNEAPAASVGTASGLLRTFGYVGSISASTITGLAFRTRVDGSGLHHVSLILLGIGIIVLLMTAFDRHLADSDRSSQATNEPPPNAVTTPHS